LDRRARAAFRLVRRRRVADGDRHVRHALAFERRAALRARIQTARVRTAGAAVDRDLRDEEVGRFHVVVVLGVGDRAAKQLLDRLRCEHAGELQKNERFANRLAANRIGDATQLARTDAGELEVRERLGALRGFEYVGHVISPTTFLGPSGL
jgi:hypothetical protein